jgi:hypothetical protein
MVFYAQSVEDHVWSSNRFWDKSATKECVRVRECWTPGQISFARDKNGFGFLW